MKPEELFFRCYARRISSDHWYAHCIDLNIDAEAPSLVEVKKSLDNAIKGYIQTVLDTKDRESLSYLIRRPSQLRHRMTYFLILCLHTVRVFRQSLTTFKESLPFHLANDCAA